MNKGYIAGLLVLAGASSAFAADMPVKARVAAVPYVQYNDILAANNQIMVQAVGTHLNYAEYDDGRSYPPGTFVDSEKGWVPGIGLKVSAMGDWAVSNLYVAAEASWSKGHTSYFEPPGVLGGPVSLTHNAQIADAAFRLGKGFGITPNFMITPFAEFGFHQWQRDTSPMNGETYEHEYAGGGLLFQYAPVQRLVLSASGMVGTTIDPKISIAANPRINTAVDLGLGSELTWRVGGAVDYAITPHFHVSGSLDYTEFKYGASARDPINGIYEPNSTSQVLVGKIGFGYSWGGGDAVVAKY
jgi:hypothetical protein